MKKTVLYLAIAAFVFTFSSCSKEQTALNQLKGTWKLTSALDDDGLPVVNQFCTAEELVTFFLCDGKDQDDCYGTTKTTTTCTNGGTATTTITADNFTYAVFEKSQMLWNGTPYEIESISKKTLKIHNTRTPKATLTYDKE